MDMYNEVTIGSYSLPSIGVISYPIGKFIRWTSAQMATLDAVSALGKVNLIGCISYPP